MSRAIDLESLKLHPLFSGLALSDLERIAQELHFVALSAGKTIIRSDEAGTSAYIIIKGSVKIHREQFDGRDVVLAILGPGQIIGEMSLTDNLSTSATVITMEVCHLVVVDQRHFQSWLHTIPGFATNLVQILSRRLRLANAQLEAHAAYDISGRVARQLLALADEYGHKDDLGNCIIPIRLTQSDFADLVGASRVRVNKVFVNYKKHRLLSVDRGRYIVLHNISALARIATTSTKTLERYEP